MLSLLTVPSSLFCSALFGDEQHTRLLIEKTYTQLECESMLPLCHLRVSPQQRSGRPMKRERRAARRKRKIRRKSAKNNGKCTHSHSGATCTTTVTTTLHKQQAEHTALQHMDT